MLVKSLLPVFLLAARAFAQDAEGSTDPAPAVDDAPAVDAASPSPVGDAAVPEASAGSASGSSSSATAEAGVTPNEPSGKTVVKAGDKVKIQWDAGATWTNMTIQLKTGANQAMKGLTVVAEGIDATKSNAYEWTIPEVNPYSQIYFFEFTNNGPNLQPATWTTRFTIASPNGDTTQPKETETVGSSLVGWGIGALQTGAAGAGAAGAGAATGASASATPTGPSRLAASATPDAAVAPGVSANESSTSAKKEASTTTKPSGSASPAPSSGAGKLVPGVALALAAVAFFV